MDLNIRTESTSAATQNWLASSHGLNVMRNVTLKNSDFVANAEGVVPSGTLLSLDADTKTYVPYVDADAEATPAVAGSGDLVCLLFADVKLTSGTYSHGAGLDRGKAIESQLPVEVSDAAKASCPLIQFV